MILLFKLIILTSLLTLGYTIVTQEGMALYRIRKWATTKKERGTKWVEPLLLCYWCQPSTWSIFSFSVAYGLHIIHNLQWNLLLYYVLTVCGSSLLNGLIWDYHLKSNAEKEMYESIKDCTDLAIENSLNEYDDEMEYENRVFNHTNN
jgi:hypothetical protein